MGIGLDTILHLVYEFVHWVIAWTVPKYGVIQVQEMGVKVTGARVKVLEPGGYWAHRKRSEVYSVNVKPVVREPADVIATTRGEDGVAVRVGIALKFSITNAHTWLIENEDAEKGMLVDVQRVVLKFVRTHTFEEIQNHDEAELVQMGQKEMGRQFGVKVKTLGITTFVETECKDLNHSGVVPGVAAAADEEEEE